MLVRHPRNTIRPQAFLPWAQGVRLQSGAGVFEAGIAQPLCVRRGTWVEHACGRNRCSGEEDAGWYLHLLGYLHGPLTSDQRELIQARYYRRESAENLANA
jgi:hypothetical protein